MEWDAQAGTASKESDHLCYGFLEEWLEGEYGRARPWSVSRQL